MKPRAYYNEINKFAAQWIRNLMAAGHIMEGEVDERSIEDVHPEDLRGFTRCHFFSGIAAWDHALTLAGWPPDREVWTGSAPCQPFSEAGKGAGFDDERHLWPAFHHLIKECRPAEILGEQVASKYVDPWIDLVQDDLEALGYAFGAVPFPSAGVGAPHIRDRLYWCANAWSHVRGSQAAPSCHRKPKSDRPANWSRGRGGMANGAWANAEWSLGRDGRSRPTEPGVPPVADGFACRVEQLRAYGNAISAPAARAFIEAVMEAS